MEKKNKLYFITMILCFIYAGVCLVQLVFSVSALFRPDAFPAMPVNDTFVRNMRPRAPQTSFLIPASGFIVSLMAGFSLLDLLRRKEKKELTKSVIDTMLTPEEKTVIQLLEDNNDELTQSELVSGTKLSKVKVSRIIKRLESLKVVTKYPYGVTNKIKLEKRLGEE